MPANLPNGFAERVFNLEMDVELPDVTQEAVNELLKLYSEAVEFYSAIKSSKYQIFTNKIQALLMKPNVSALFKDQFKNRNPVQKKSVLTQIQYIQSMDSEKQVQQLMTAAQEDSQKVKNLIEDDFRMQDHRMQQRMLKRISDPNKYNQAISKSTSLRHLKLDVEQQQNSQQEANLLESLDTQDTQPIQPEQNAQLKLPPQHNIPHKASPLEAKLNCKTEQDEEEPIQLDLLPMKAQFGDPNHAKTKKVRELVNRNQMLRKQKTDLQNFLPY